MTQIIIALCMIQHLKMNRFFIIIFLVCSTAYADSQQTSGVTASEMIADVRSDYNEDTENNYSDGLLLNYLNDGMRSIASFKKSMEETEEVTLQDDTLEYPITKNYIGVEAVTIKKNTGEVYAFERGSLSHMNRTIISGDYDSPALWCEFNNKIIIYPVETVVDEDATFGGDDIEFGGDDVVFGNERVTLYLKERPYDIIASDTIKTPAKDDLRLKNYILYRMSLRDKWVGYYGHFWSQFAE